jgi:hypothetical protein
LRRRRDLPDVYAENTSLRTALGVFGVMALGVLLLWASSGVAFFESHGSLRSVVRDLGALLVATVVAAIIWELVVRRAFLGEVLALIGSEASVRKAGITWVSDNFHDVEWAPLFEGVREFDGWLTYGHSWRGENVPRLASLAGDREATLRIALPDPEDDTLAAELARRYSLDSPETAKEQWRDARDDFVRMFDRPETRAHCQLWYINTKSPLFSLYRFDRAIIFSVYRHGPGSRGTVPALRFENPGSLYEWVRSEFEALIDPENTFARLEYERLRARRRPATRAL